MLLDGSSEAKERVSCKQCVLVAKKYCVTFSDEDVLRCDGRKRVSLTRLSDTLFSEVESLAAWTFS